MTAVCDVRARRARLHLGSAAQHVLRVAVPLVLTALLGGAMLALFGANPMHFYAEVLRLGLVGQGWQRSLTVAAPLLLVALGLIIAFRAGLWNLGYHGSYVLAAAVVAGVAPVLMATLPFMLAVAVLTLIALTLGAAVSLVPAWLKVTSGAPEVVTSLMMSFIAVGVANLLIKGPLQDPATSVPQTRVLGLELMLPFLPGTQVHAGVVPAFVLVLLAQLILTRSAFGTRIDMLGASPRAAVHAGVRVSRLVPAVMLISGALIGVAALVDMLGLWGYMRSDWNPGYGEKVLPFVFLARLSPLAAAPLICGYAVFLTGGTVAAQQAGLAIEVLDVYLVLLLVCMVLLEALGRRFPLGESYLPAAVGSLRFAFLRRHTLPEDR